MSAENEDRGVGSAEIGVLSIASSTSVKSSMVSDHEDGMVMAIETGEVGEADQSSMRGLAVVAITIVLEKDDFTFNTGSKLGT